MSTKISKGSIIASFIYEKSTNLEGYEEMDLLTIYEVKKIKTSQKKVQKLIIKSMFIINN